MSLRKVWIVNTEGHVKFSRLFGTVERRARISNQATYVPLVDDALFGNQVISAVGLSHPWSEFVPSRDTCGRIDQKPVFKMENGLWPLLVIEQQGLLFCCLPLVDGILYPKPKLVEIPGISIGFMVLLAMADFLRQKQQRFSELHQYTLDVMPFGTPISSLDGKVTEGLIQASVGSSRSPAEVIPAWKPVPFKGKNVVKLSVVENVRGVVYDGLHGAQSVWQVFGSVLCKADLEGYANDVSLTLSSTTALDQLTVHACVQQADAEPGVAVAFNGKYLRKLRFSPPPDSVFTLCYYTCTYGSLPVMGCYQMRLDNGRANLLVQLQLAQNVPNSFEFFEVVLPWHNRAVLDMDLKTPCGSLHVDSDKSTIIWAVGRKWPGKSRELTLNGTVTLSDKTEDAAAGSSDNRFFVANNAFMLVKFRSLDFTLSALQVETNSIHVSPVKKTKNLLTQELHCREYKIWNTHGDVLTL